MSTPSWRFAMVSTDIRRDLVAPLRYFARLDITHFYHRAPYEDLGTEDWDTNLIHYGSPQQLYRLILRAHPDLIQGVEPFSIRLLPYLYSAYLAARSRGVPLIITTLENRPLAEKYGQGLGCILRMLLRPVFKYAKLIIYLNHGALQNMRTVGDYETKTQYLMYGTWGVDLEEFAPGPKQWITRRSKILFVGRLDEEKGIFDLLAAFERVRSALSDARLTLIGDGPDRGKIERTIAALSCNGSVQLVGTVKNRDLPAYFQQTDVFVAPSITTRKWEEQVGMTNLQAMACGVPVVSTLSGAIPEYVPDGEAGILVPECNPEALADAILYLLRNDALRHTIGQQARTYSELHYDARTNVKRAEDLIIERCLRSTPAA